MKILLVEDDQKIAQFITQGLSQEGYRVIPVSESSHPIYRTFSSVFTGEIKAGAPQAMAWDSV